MWTLYSPSPPFPLPPFSLPPSPFAPSPSPFPPSPSPSSLFLHRAVTASSLEVSQTTNIPTSPSSTRRPLRLEKSEGSVWTRLTTTAGENAGDMSKGSLQAERADSRRNAPKLLNCTHTACGHSAGILSVCATQHYLFSASQGKC